MSARAPWTVTTARAAHALDVALLRQIHGFARPGLTQSFHLVCRMADAIAWPVHAAAVLLVGGLRPAPGLAIVFATLLATMISQPLKRSIRRPRPRERLPDLRPPYADPDGFSLPSGHAAAAVAVAVALSAGHFPLAGLYLVFAALVCLGRVVLGAHYPGDVLAGAAIGWFAGSLAAQLVASAMALL